MSEVAEAPAETGSLSILNTAVAEFDRVAAGIAELESKYKSVVFDVTTTKGMKEACEARLPSRWRTNHRCLLQSPRKHKPHLRLF